MREIAVTTSADDRALVLALKAEGFGRNEISRKTGVSTGRVSSIVKDAGESFAADTDQLAEARRARSEQTAQVRGEVEELALEGARRQAQRVLEPYEQVVVTPNGTVVKVQLDEPPAREAKDLLDATVKGITVSRINRALEPDNDLDRAVGQLDRLWVGLNLLYAEQLAPKQLEQ